VTRPASYLAVALLAASLIAACGRDPGSAERVVTVAEMPSPEQVAPAQARADALERFYQVQWFGAVARWSWVVTVRYAAAVDRARFVARRPTELHPTSSTPHRAGPANADGSVWGRLAACESSGNWASTVGSFEGGLQFSNATWLAYGGGAYAQHAYDATPAQQIAVAERVLASQGPSAWPICSYRAGLR
jgi:hypothetical protein